MPCAHRIEYFFFLNIRIVLINDDKRYVNEYVYNYSINRNIIGVFNTMVYTVICTIYIVLYIQYNLYT